MLHAMAVVYVAGARHFVVAHELGVEDFDSTGADRSLRTRDITIGNDIYNQASLAARADSVFYTEGSDANPVLFHASLSDPAPTFVPISLATNGDKRLYPTAPLSGVQFGGPRGLAFAADGSLYVADVRRQAVYLVHPALSGLVDGSSIVDVAFQENDDCEHFAIWVATRVASDSLARGTMVLELRELSDDDDDFGYVAVANDIAVTCALESGAIEPRGREGEIFLRHHPWLVDSLRAEVEFFRERAARAAAQLDRESAAKKALAVPASTMIAYHRLFPADWDLIPIRDGERYWAVDLYCRNPDCSCASSAIQFYKLDHGDPERIGEVVVDYAERDIEYEASDDAVEAIFDQLWSAREYSLRARHAEARDAVRRFAIRTLPSVTPRASLDRVPRNAVCPCGSGKKFKRCCLDASRIVRP